LIEIDGESHLEPIQAEYDKARTEYLEALGYKVIRFTNDDVRYNIHEVVSQILRTVENRIIQLKDKRKLTLRSPRPSPERERGKEQI
jgi:very-short-patch-repair endonuclease